MKSEHSEFSKIVNHDFREIKIADFNEIIYCKAEGNYTRIYFENTSILVTKVLKHFESCLPSGAFFRIHKSYLVNINFISCFKAFKLVLIKGDIEIPIARRRRSRLFKEISKSHLLIANLNNRPIIQDFDRLPYK